MTLPEVSLALDVVDELLIASERPDYAQVYLRHLCVRAACEIARLRTQGADVQRQPMDTRAGVNTNDL